MWEKDLQERWCSRVGCRRGTDSEVSETYLVDSDLSMNVPIWVIASTFAFHYYVGARLEAPTLLCLHSGHLSFR